MFVDRFEDLECWQEARKLVSLVYKVSAVGRFSKDFRFSSQIQAAAISAMSNIAEGFDRRSKIEFLRFLDIAYSSLAEVQSQVYAALDLDYIAKDDFNNIYEQTKKSKQITAGLIRYIKNKRYATTAAQPHGTTQERTLA